MSDYNGKWAASGQGRRFALALAACASLAPAGPAAAGGAIDRAAAELGLGPTISVTTERIVRDPVTGLALGGYDPVAYFTEGRPVAGLAAHEAAWNGAVWRFANEGNRAAFVEAPEIYMPAYGGHCTRHVADGSAADGDPRLFVLREGRVFLFRTLADRDAWLTRPETFVRTADRAWPAMERSLAR